MVGQVVGTCFFFWGEPKKSVEELGETKLDNYIFQGYQNEPTKTSTDENFGGTVFVLENLRNSAAFHVKIARLKRNIMLQAPVLPLWASCTSRCPL